MLSLVSITSGEVYGWAGPGSSRAQAVCAAQANCRTGTADRRRSRPAACLVSDASVRAVAEGMASWGVGVLTCRRGGRLVGLGPITETEPGITLPEPGIT